MVSMYGIYSWGAEQKITTWKVFIYDSLILLWLWQNGQR